MSDEQFHTFEPNVPGFFQGLRPFIETLPQLIQSFQEPLSADDILCLARLYTIRQVLYALIRGFEPKTLVALGRIEDALAMARFHVDAQYRFSHLSDTYDALIESGQPAPGLLDEILSVAQQIEDTENQITSRDWLSKAFAESGRFEEALHMARSIPKFDHGLDRRATSLFTIAAQLRKASLHTQADEIFAEAQARFAEVGGSWDGISSLVSRISDAAENNRHDELAEIVEAIQNKLNAADYPHRELWFMRTARALARVNEKKLADSFFAQAMAAVRGLDDGENTLYGNTKLSSLSQLIEALAVSGFISEADALLSELSQFISSGDRRDSPNYFHSAQARVLAQQGNFAEARMAALNINSSWRRPLLNELAVMFARNGQLAEAESVLSDIARASLHTTDWAQRTLTLSAMAVVWHHAGNARAADFLFLKAVEALRFERWERTGRRGNELRTVVKALAQTGRYAQAREVAGGYDYALCDIALVEIQAGQDVDAVLAHVAHLITGGDYIHKHLAPIYVAAGRVAEAEVIFDKAIEATRTAMRRSSLTLSRTAFANFLTTLDTSGFSAKSNNLLNEAIQVARENTDPILRPRILFEMAICLARKNRLDEARMLIGEGIAASETWIYMEQPEALAEIALSLAKSGLHQEAQTTFRQSWEAVERMAIFGLQQREARSDATGALARLLCEAGYVAEAREATFKIEYGFNNNAVRHLAVALIKSGKVADAFQVIGTDLSQQFWPSGVDDFLETIAECSVYLDNLRPGLTVTILQEAARIAGSVFSDWQEIHRVLAEPQP